MTTYKYYDGSITDMIARNEAFATPGENNKLCVRRAWVDTPKQSLTAATPDIAQVIPLAKNEIVLGVWVRVATAESTSNAEFSIGLDAENNRFLDNVVATTANTVASEFSEAAHISNNTSAITLVPSNSVNLDTAVIEVAALVAVSLDADGDRPDVDYAYPLS